MKKYTSREIEKILREYRSISWRLNRTDYHQCASNLIEFMEFIDENELIKEFISEYNECKYDIKKILMERPNFRPFIAGSNKKEKISMAYQMLKYAIDNFNGDYTFLYGRGYYVGGNDSFDAQLKKFNEHIVDPLIEYIKQYLEEVYRNTLEQERGNNMLGTEKFTFNNSNVIFNSGNVDGNLSANVTVMNDGIQKEIEELLKIIEKEVKSINLDTKEEVFELISKVDQTVKANQEPRLSWLGKIKNFCEGSTIIVTCIDKIIELISKLG